MATNNSTPSPSTLTPNGARTDSLLRSEQNQHSNQLPDQSTEFRNQVSSLKNQPNRDFLIVNSTDLVSFSNKFPDAEDLLIEAIQFGEMSEQWNFWICCCCNKKFTDSESHFQHLMANHLNYYHSSPQLACLVTPVRVTSDWISIINNEIWKPADTSLVFTTLENELASLSSKGEVVHLRQLPEFDSKQWAKGCFFDRNWPLSDDSNRAACLRNIQIVLQSLLSDELLLAMHLDYVLYFSMVKLQRKFRGGSIWGLLLDQNHLCICLLGEQELREILKFLETVEEKGVVYDGLKHTTPSFELEETEVTIALKDESFYLISMISDEDSICNGSEKPAMNFGHHEAGELQCSNSLLSWIFSKQQYMLEPCRWDYLRGESKFTGRKELLNFQAILKIRKEESVEFEECTRTSDSYPSDDQLSKKGDWIVKLSEDVHQFENKINANAANDFRPFLMLLLKRHFKSRLKKALNHYTRYVSEDAATGEHDGGDSFACNGFVATSSASNGFVETSPACNGFVATSSACNGFAETSPACNGFVATSSASNGFVETSPACNGFVVTDNGMQSLAPSSACNGFVVTDNGRQSLVPEGKYVDSTNSSDSSSSDPSSESEDSEKWNVEDEEETETSSDSLEWYKELVEMERSNEKDLLGFVEREGELLKRLNQEEEVKPEMLGISQEEADMQAAIEESLGLSQEEADMQAAIEESLGLAGQGAKLPDMHGSKEGAKLEMLGQNNQREKASIEDDVGTENLSSFQKEWSDADHEWQKSVMLFQNKFDEGALAQSVLQKKKVEALFDKFVQMATKSK